ncbi:Hypothetical predicted protein [Mytilus galloprovincialis]|uniref:DUF1758 domain-containing protein n=1 Tax=Mytilus galloprovincialis TaxID=29158 RepID=A0A8B6HLI2_MYTGA|nr:Hypothetical predicted protein [Mytilus galloprovincialis]
MDISRLKSLRAGNKAAVTKVFKKLGEAIGDSQTDTEEVSTFFEAIEKKKNMLVSIDEQILNAVESEDITNEILETDEYYLDLEGKIRKFKKYLKPVPKSTSSILDSNAPEFVPYTNPFTHTSQQLSQSSSTSSKHKITDCKSKNTCKCCHRKHHSSLCKQNSYSNKHHIETEQSQNKVDTETSMLYTASEERSTVLLKTAFSPVFHKNTCIDARILFDEGAQRSFITEELAAKLDIKKEGSETLSIATFGNTTKKVRNLDKTTINLKSSEGELIPIKVLIVPTIASPLQTHNIG